MPGTVTEIHTLRVILPVAGGESTEEWLEFLDGMRVHFEPIGTYERELVDRIAIDLWSLRRVARTVQ